MRQNDGGRTAPYGEDRVMNDDVRPLSVGEILDRAITAFVRNLVPLFALLGTIAVPIAIITALAAPQTASLLDAFGQLTRVAPGDTDGIQRVLRQLNLASRPSGWSGLVLLLTFLGYPYARTAFLMYVNTLGDGVRMSIPAALRGALGRLVPQLVVELGVIVVFVVAMIAVFIVTFIGALAIGGVSLVGRTLAIVLGVVLGTVLVGLLLALFVWIYMAWEFAIVGVAVEDPNPIRAIGRALRRTFDRALIWRTLLVGFALVIIETVGGLVFGAAGVAAVAVLHAPVLQAFLVAVGRIVLDGLQMLFVFFYVRDVRVRREGLDLVRAISAEPATA